MPFKYVEAAFGGYEVPNAQAASVSATLNVADEHPDVTISQVLPSLAGDPAGPNKPSAFRISFAPPIDPASFDVSDLSLATSSATSPALGVLVPVVPGSEYTVPVAASGDGTLTLTTTAGATCAAGHFSAGCDAGFESDPPTYDDNEIEWDQTGPTVSIVPAAGQLVPSATSPILFTVEFGETFTTAPIGFDASDVDLSASTAPGTLIAEVTQPDLLVGDVHHRPTRAGHLVLQARSWYVVAVSVGRRDRSPDVRQHGDRDDSRQRPW